MNRLVAIVGPTATGKSELGMRVAKEFNGEIICADSRTIYKGMDIGTAKPSEEDQREVSHHLLNLIQPNQAYSASEFKTAALQAITEIQSRDHLPILVGGSGLYAYAVLYDYQFPAGPSNSLRDELQQLSLDHLVRRLQLVDPEAASSIDLKNPRRVIRAIETAGQPKLQQSLRQGTVLVGLRPNEDELAQRISIRAKSMVDDGLTDEAKRIVDAYGDDLEVLKSPGYADPLEYLGDKTTKDALCDLIALHTRQMAKRQLTWFKRNPDIHWFSDTKSASKFVQESLQAQKV